MRLADAAVREQFALECSTVVRIIREDTYDSDFCCKYQPATLFNISNTLYRHMQDMPPEAISASTPLVDTDVDTTRTSTGHPIGYNSRMKHETLLAEATAT